MANDSPYGGTDRGRCELEPVRWLLVEPAKFLLAYVLLRLICRWIGEEFAEGK